MTSVLVHLGLFCLGCITAEQHLYTGYPAATRFGHVSRTHHGELTFPTALTEAGTVVAGKLR